MRTFKIPHGKRDKYCPTCCEIREDGLEETPHKIFSLDISHGSRGCFGPRRSIFENWECQRCGSVHLV